MQDIARARFSLALAAVLWIQFQLVESGYFASYLLVQIHNILLLLGPWFSAISELALVENFFKISSFCTPPFGSLYILLQSWGSKDPILCSQNATELVLCLN